MTDRRIVETLTDHQQRRIDAQNITRGETAELVVDVYGPLSRVVKEVAIRQQALEDALGLTFVPTTKEFAAHFVPNAEPVGQPRCTRCGAALDTDAARLTMICATGCDAPVMDMGEGWEGSDGGDVE